MPRFYPRLPLPPSWKPKGNDLAHLFTPKEQNIMDGVICGNTNAQIAQLLESTEHVIKNYLRVIFDKAGVDTRLELALWWLEHGYTSDHVRTDRDVWNDRRETAKRWKRRVKDDLRSHSVVLHKDHRH